MENRHLLKEHPLSDILNIHQASLPFPLLRLFGWDVVAFLGRGLAWFFRSVFCFLPRLVMSCLSFEGCVLSIRVLWYPWQFCTFPNLSPDPRNLGTSEQWECAQIPGCILLLVLQKLLPTHVFLNRDLSTNEWFMESWSQNSWTRQFDSTALGLNRDKGFLTHYSCASRQQKRFKAVCHLEHLGRIEMQS